MEKDLVEKRCLSDNRRKEGKVDLETACDGVGITVSEYYKAKERI